jgi:hypothetical protein
MRENCKIASSEASSVGLKGDGMVGARVYCNERFRDEEFRSK